MNVNTSLNRLQNFSDLIPINSGVLTLVLILHAAIFWILQSSMTNTLTQSSQNINTMIAILDLQAPQMLKMAPTEDKGANNSKKTKATPLTPQGRLSQDTNSIDRPHMKSDSRLTDPSAAILGSSTAVDNVQSLTNSNSKHNQNTLSSGIELPNSRADYLNNPKPRYPSASLRLEEQGKVVVRVFIGIDGIPQKIELGISSGFDRLDRAALEAVKEWRFVPGTRAGVPEAMWLDVPVIFKIN